MDPLLIAGIVGAVAVGGLALYSWYRARQLERHTERLLARISHDIDQLVLRTQRGQDRQGMPHAAKQDARAGHSLSRAA